MSTIAKQVLGEGDEQLKRLAQVGGVLPPYADMKKIRRAAARLPEFVEEFSSNIRIYFESVQSVKGPNQSRYKWSIELLSVGDPPIPHLVLNVLINYASASARAMEIETRDSSLMYTCPRPGKAVLDALWPDAENFLERLRKIAVFKVWNPGPFPIKWQ